MVFEPSKYQTAIFQTVEAGYGLEQLTNIVVSAVAGSGKSTTLKQLLEHVPADREVLYLTFGHDVNEDLAVKIKAFLKDMRARKLPRPKASCKTIHSMGNGCLYAVGIRGDAMKGKRKYNRLAQNYLKAHMTNYSYPLSEQLKALIDKVRVTLTDPTEGNLIALLRRFTDITINPEDQDVWPLIVRAVPHILDAGIKQAQSQTAPIIDFTDQIWLPSSQALNLQPRQFDVVLVDEAQDLSPCQRELVRKACKSSGMKVYVGDRDQSIMAFAGASLRSIDEIIEAEQPRVLELPLSICYRCPRAVVEFAATLRPGIEAWEGVGPGAVEKISNDRVVYLVQSGDLILCRVRAPLVEKCLELLRMKKRATVLGMDLGQTFEGLIERILQHFSREATVLDPNAFYEALVALAQTYEEAQLVILKENEEENESRIIQLQDNIATLLALWEGHREQTLFPGQFEPFPLTFGGFIAFINRFFQEDKDAQIVLSTGHKAKGLEYPNVYILSWDRLPHSRATTPEALKQEYNLMYVMSTRVLYDANNPQSGTLYVCYEELPEEVEESETSVFSSFHEAPEWYDRSVVEVERPDELYVESTLTSVEEMVIEDTLQGQAEEVIGEIADVPIVKKAGRPKKGKGRSRKNCSFDVDVAAYLESLSDFSNYLEEFVLTDPQYAAFLQARAESGEGESEGEDEPEEKEPTIQIGVEVVTLACPTCGKNVDARDGTQLFDAEEWMRLPQTIDCVACSSIIKLPLRSPFKKTSKKKVKAI